MKLYNISQRTERFTEPESHVVHQRNKMVLVERELIGRSGPDRML